MISFKQYLTEGGNVVINGIPAERLDLTKLSRTEVVNSLEKGINAINASFNSFAGFPLWSKELMKSLDYLSGSAKWFFDLSGISDDEFTGSKPSVGDIDTQVDGAAKDIIKNWLNSLSPGTTLGTLTYVGYKQSGDQYITLWETEFNQAVQVDIELVEFVGGKPTRWSIFSHSSAWDDIKRGIKGAFHKHAMRSLVARETKDVILLKGKKRTPKEENVSDYAASVKGIRKRIQPELDEAGKQVYMNGKPVYVELPSKDAQYYTDMEVFFNILFNVKPTPSDLKDINSFVGMIDIIKRYIIDSRQQKNIVDRFAEILFGKGAQGLYRGDKLRDFREKSVALRYICKELNIPWSGYIPMIRQYYRSYK